MLQANMSVQGLCR
uniref:Uncharacterized protein n=1 Tax=Anguilla anguilla TaxID=7936 RepID=A0A0E9UBR2_ANGAN